MIRLVHLLVFFGLYFPTVCSVEYQVRMTTGDKFGAGTSANVWINIQGTRGALGQNKLPTLSDDMEAESIDTYTVNGPDVGELQVVELKRDKAGIYDAWFLQKVEVRYKRSDKWFTFVYCNWVKPHEWTSIALSSCPKGYKFGSGRYCIDIDECQSNPCLDPAASCVNTNGSFACKCPRGFHLANNRPTDQCVDINECKVANDCTSIISTCENTQGSYHCKCADGYVNTSRTQCVDKDECASNDSNVCSRNASECVNFPGDYSCKCRPGFYRGSTNKSCVRCNSYDTPLGLESGEIPDSSLSANSHYTAYPPSMARLHCGSDCAWYALPSHNNMQPWLQVDLANVTLVSGIATQGKRFANYVKSYKIKFSDDGISWSDYKESGQVRHFQGNTDPYTVVKRKLNTIISARFIRIYPLTWNDALTLKLELYGCKEFV